MSDKAKRLLLFFSLIIGGLAIGIILHKFVPCKDYSIPLFIVLGINIYLDHSLKKYRKSNE